MEVNKKIQQSDMIWREFALCANKPTEDFFPQNVTKKNIHKINQVKSICSQCSVAPQCLLEAVTYEYDGIWGGTLLRERISWVNYMKRNGVVDITIDDCMEILGRSSINILESEQGENDG